MIGGSLRSSNHTNYNVLYTAHRHIPCQRKTPHTSHVVIGQCGRQAGAPLWEPRVTLRVGRGQGEAPLRLRVSYPNKMLKVKLLYLVSVQIRVGVVLTLFVCCGDKSQRSLLGGTHFSQPQPQLQSPKLIEALACVRPRYSGSSTSLLGRSRSGSSTSLRGSSGASARSKSSSSRPCVGR